MVHVCTHTKIRRGLWICIYRVYIVISTVVGATAQLSGTPFCRYRRYDQVEVIVMFYAVLFLQPNGILVAV